MIDYTFILCFPSQVIIRKEYSQDLKIETVLNTLEPHYNCFWGP